MEELKEEPVRVKGKKKNIEVEQNRILKNLEMRWSWWRRFLCG
jgi:hypothetical protein